MKMVIIYLKLWCFNINKTNSFIASIVFLGICLSNFSFAQITTNSCQEITKTFSGSPAATLCDLYENLSSPLLIGEGMLLTHSSQIGTSYSGTVHVMGDFIVDNSFLFINCIIKVEPGVTIYVQSPASLLQTYLFVIDNSKLFACDNMWNGIVLSTNTSIMTRNNTVIEDAIKAIKAEDVQYCALFIENTTFNRNDIGIFLSHNTNISKPAIIYRLSKNLFKCTAPLNGTLDQISSAGIHLENNQILSINPIVQANTNKFIGLFRGILATGFTTIINGKFLIFEDCKYAGITINGILNLEACRFTNCGYAGVDLQSVTNVKPKSCIRKLVRRPNNFQILKQVLQKVPSFSLS